MTKRTTKVPAVDIGLRANAPAISNLRARPAKVQIRRLTLVTIPARSAARRLSRARGTYRCAGCAAAPAHGSALRARRVARARERRDERRACAAAARAAAQCGQR